MDWSVSETVYGLNASHYSSTFHSFDWSRVSSGKKEAMAEFLQTIQSRHEYRVENGRFPEDPAPHIFMHGPPGAGKTHLSVSAYRWVVKRTDLSQAAFFHLPDLCDAVMDSYGVDESHNAYREVERAKLLVVLDDIFSRDVGEHAWHKIVPKIINIVYSNDAALIVTTNYNPSQASERFHDHEMSRIMQAAQEWEFQEGGYRIREHDFS